jgi:sulfoxide reductase heme-binding subunit YedZ
MVAGSGLDHPVKWRVETVTPLFNAGRERFLSRIYYHHIPLFFASLLAVAWLYVTRPYKDVISRLSFATAYPALVLLVLTLLIGPWNLLRRRRNPVSSDLRRDTGIWAGIVGLIHTVVGQNMHLRGRPWLYYVYQHRPGGPSGLRHDLFGFNNFTGLASTLVLILLLATSNDWFLRRLGTPRWKQLQRWNYACFALAAAHSVGYQVNAPPKRPFLLLTVLAIALTLILQGVGYSLRRQRPIA